MFGALGAAARGLSVALIDPHWKSGKIKRGDVYRAISTALGRTFHSAELTGIEEARKVYVVARDFLRARRLVP